MSALVRALFCFALAAAGCASSAEEPQWLEVERGSLVIEVDVSGALRAVDSNTIGPPGIPGVWNYKIAMMAPEGGEVEKDTPILAFDTSELSRRLEQKTAERDSAAKQVEMSKAKAKVNEQDNALALATAQAELRKATLTADVPADITSGIDLEKAKLDLELAKTKVDYLGRKVQGSRRADEAEIDRWRSQRDRAEERVAEIGASIQQMTVMAPRAGTVIYEANWKGEKKKVGDGAWRGETLLQVVSLDEMEATGEIDEVDSSRVAVGQAVSLRLDAQADVELAGKIREISRTVQRQSPDNPLKVVKIEISLAPAEGTRLRPGMRFWGKVETERLDDALRVPLEAVLATASGPVVFRRVSGDVEAVSVTLGRRNASDVEVTEGLEEGDEIDPNPAARTQEAAR